MSSHTPAIRPSSAVGVTPAPTLALMDPVQFEQMQRVGKMLALSPLFPAHLRTGSEPERIANGVLVMNMAVRLREDPLTVAQNIYFVGGRPGWNTTYMIAKANMHGVFKDPIDWEVTGKGDSLSATAFAVLAGTGKRVQMTADMEMAKAEGWTKNAKYKSIPETMLRYRSAAALIRMYCPEVMIGIPAGIEVETEMRDVTPSRAQEVARSIEAEPVDVSSAEIVDAETGEVQQAEEQPTEVKEPEKTTAPRRKQTPRTDSTPYTEGGPKAGEQAAMDMGEPDPTIAILADNIDAAISADLSDGAGLADTLDMYSAQLDQIRVVDPARHAEMIASYEAFAAEH
ncbi:hypothetical protein JWJ88_17180 [Paracoccus methylovorus]|uniref:Recombinase RecT n=1 Tax=Paracoccus methylovorus TaxID=2812658 RepID=A0ABX7JPY7_9RHOB|nr:hypothetical protein [Paracoccus methylovorus]QRZ14697.1 hypothetical protein JWJ88_17180 [Paracoccus methylovorus]